MFQTSLLFYDCLFTLVTFLTGDAFKTELNAAERSTFQGALEYCLQEILNQGQSSRSEAIMLAEEIVACWSGILEKGLDILSQIEGKLVNSHTDPGFN